MSKKEKIGTEFDKSTLTYLKEIGNYPSLTQKEEYELWKDTLRQSLRDGGRPLAYQQMFSAQWDIPINKIPGLDWITARAQYSANYNWSTGVVYDGINSMGNTITNLAQWQGDGILNFETLYNKSKYVKDLEQKLRQRSSGRGGGRQQKFNPRTLVKTVVLNDTAPVKINHKLLLKH